MDKEKHQETMNKLKTITIGFEYYNDLLKKEDKIKELQQRIDKANNILSKILVIKDGNKFRPIKNTSSQDVYKAIILLNKVLDTPYRIKDYKGD